jgi:hypothetical protein
VIWILGFLAASSGKPRGDQSMQTSVFDRRSFDPVFKFQSDGGEGLQ